MQSNNTFSIRAIVLCILFASTSLVASAQETPPSSGVRYFNVGVGTSSWGVPIYANLEFPLKGTENISMAVGGSYQAKSESYNYYWYNATWRHTIMGINVAGNYYADEVLGLPEQFDVYGGLQLDYYIWKTNLKDSDDGFNQSYSGSGLGGLGVSGIVGGRYHFGSSKRTSINVVLGGGTVLSSGKVGISVRL